MNGDRINPIVVKELRQGLKSRSFLLSFVGLQLAMVISMFIYITSAVNSRGRLEGADVFFWTVLGILLLFLMPFRSFQALNEEIKHKTLELIFLTRMSSWQIAMGKWIAHAIQVLLMVCAVLPYFVLRYFLGSINITSNLIILAVCVAFSLVATAAGVGLSAWQSKLLRLLVLLGGVIGIWSFGSGAMMFIGMRRMGGAGVFAGAGPGLLPEFWVLLGFAVAIPLVILYFVEYGASKIAPPAENHAGRKRLLGVALVALFCIWAFAEYSGELILFATVVLGPMLCIGPILEPIHRIPALYRGGRRLGPLRWLSYPGWPSGLVFSILLFLALAIMGTLLENDEEVVYFFISLFNTYIAAFLLIRIFPKLQGNPVLSYLCLQVAALLTTLMFIVLLDIGIFSSEMFGLLGIFIPMMGLMSFDHNSVWEGNLIGHVLVTLFFGFLALRFAIHGFIKIRQLQDCSIDEPWE